MKKKTFFYVFLAIWVVALATLAGVLISNALDKDDPTVTNPPPSTEQSGGGSGSGGSGNGGGGSSSEDDDDKNWTANY